MKSSLAALKQFAYAHKKTSMGAAVMGTIGCLMYSLGKRDIRLLFNGSESLLSQTWGNVFYNLAIKTVSFFNHSGVNLFHMLKYTSSEVANEISLLSPYAFIQAVHETISLILVTGFVTAMYQLTLLMNEQGKLESLIFLEKKKQLEFPQGSDEGKTLGNLPTWMWSWKTLKYRIETEPPYFIWPLQVQYLSNR